MVQVGKVFSHRKNQDELDPLGRLEVPSAGHFDPAPRSQIFLPKDGHRHQRRDGSDVHPMNSIKQLLIVDETHQKHAGDSTTDPVKLPDVRPGKLGVRGGAADLEHAKAADQQNKDQQQPVKIAK